MLNLSHNVVTAMWGFFVAAVCVYLLTPLMTRLAHRAGAVDTPTDERRMHIFATPLLGGLAIYFGVLIATLTLVHVSRVIAGIIIGATLVTVVGLIDDLFEIRPLLKFAGQLAAIGVAIWFDVRVTRLAVPLTGFTWHLPYYASIIVTVVWIAAIINMVNFIDGLDGLAAGICAISSLTFSVIALSMGRASMGALAAVLAGAAFAFLRFNFYPASIFMGDAGSMLLGFMLGAISVQSFMKVSASVTLLLPLLVLGIPFIDLFLVVFRRWRRGVPFYSPGQDHVHHDLVLVAGFSQRKSVLLLYGWCILLNGLAIAMREESRWAEVVLGVAAAIATASMARLLYRSRSAARRVNGAGGPPEAARPASQPAPPASPEPHDELPK